MDVIYYYLLIKFTNAYITIEYTQLKNHKNSFVFVFS